MLQQIDVRSFLSGSCHAPKFVRASLLLALLTAFTQPARATTITAAGTVVQNSIPGGGLGTDGYLMYNEIASPGGGAGSTMSTANNIEVNPAYVSSITPYPNATYYNAPHGVYTVLTVAGTPYDSGVIYRSSDGTLATITLAGSGLPSSFELGLLSDNENDNGPGHRNQSFTVSAPGSSATEIPSGSLSTNRFYLFNVTNLTPGDAITISGIQGSDGLLLGGITFNSIPTPEPASLTLAGLGLVGLAWTARRRGAR